MTEVRGTIVSVVEPENRGTICGPDGKVRPFIREHMVLWLQFLDLQPGARVVFDIDETGEVINVEAR